MFLSVTILLLISLVLPLRSHKTYQQVHEMEKRRITIDNVSIRAGRLGRTLLNSSLKVEGLLLKLHHAYHLARACESLPKPVPVCRLGTKVLKRTIQGLFQRSQQAMQAFWPKISRLARLEADNTGVRVCRVDFPPRLPLSTGHCRICGLESHWRFRRVDYEVRDCPGREPDLSVSGAIRKGRQYQYVLFP